MMQHSQATKLKLSEMRRGDRNPFYGRKHSPETIQALRSRRRALNATRQYDIQPITIADPQPNTWAYTKYGKRIDG